MGRADEKGRRLFISLKVPDEILSECVAFQEKASLIAKEKTVSIRWTDPKQIHLTLIFLGWTNPLLQDQISEIIYNASCESEPFEIKMARLGVYPGLQEPRIIWAGISEETDLMILQGKLACGVASLGSPPEKRPYRPHLTLGRVKGASGARGFCRWMVEENCLHPETGLMKEISLMESRPRPEGSIYIPLLTSVLGEEKRN